MILKKVLYVGLIQGVLWTLMSMLCLIYHYRSEPYEVPYTYFGMFYFVFLAPSTNIDELILQPDTFAALMWCYLVLSISWTILLISIMFEQQNLTFKLAKTLKTCAIAYTLITIFDAILFIAISVDFKSLCRSAPYYYNGLGYTNQIVEMLCTKGFIPVWVISIRFGLIFIYNIYSANVLRLTGKLINLEVIAAGQRLNNAQVAATAAQINISAEDRAIDNNAIDNDYLYSPYNRNSYYNSYDNNNMRTEYKIEYSNQYNPRTGNFEYLGTPVHRMQRY